MFHHHIWPSTCRFQPFPYISSNPLAFTHTAVELSSSPLAIIPWPRSWMTWVLFPGLALTIHITKSQSNTFPTHHTKSSGSNTTMYVEEPIYLRRLFTTKMWDATIKSVFVVLIATEYELMRGLPCWSSAEDSACLIQRELVCICCMVRPKINKLKKNKNKVNE